MMSVDPMGPAPGTMKLSMPVVTMPPGTETTHCMTAHFTTADPVDVVQIDAQLNSSHHIIFYREDPSAQDAPPHPCQPLSIDPFSQSMKAPIFIGESKTAQLKMPQGVAYNFAPGAPYTLEVHYLNASAQPIDASADIVLTLAKKGQATTRADMLFYASVTALNKSYDQMGKGLPPGKVTTIDPAGFHSPRSGIKIFGMTSHQHRLGTGFVISRSMGPDDAGQMLFHNSDWEHPPLLRFPDDQLLTLDSDKGEGLRWVCTYNNTNDYYVTFGQSGLKNEMCILWAYYYPAQGFDIYFE